MATTSKRRFGEQSYFNQTNSNIPTGQRYLTIKGTVGNEALNALSVFQKTKGLVAISSYADIIAKLKDGTLLVLTKNKQAAEIIIKAKTLANVDIIVAEHEFLNYTKGIIFSNDLVNVSSDELLEEFKAQHVVEIYRIQKRKPNSDSFENTSGLILTFNLTNIPETIIAGYVNIRVRQYIPNPLRCRKCQVFGHTKNRCSNDAACDVCSIKDAHKLPCENTKKCVNCGGLHSSFDRKCEVFIKEAEIMFLKTTQRISYFDAKKQVEEKIKQQQQQHLFAEVVANNANVPADVNEINTLKAMIEEMNKTAKASKLELLNKFEEVSRDNKKLLAVNQQLVNKLESQSIYIKKLQSDLDGKDMPSQKDSRKESKSRKKLNALSVPKETSADISGSGGFSGELRPQTPLIKTIVKSGNPNETNISKNNNSAYATFPIPAFNLKTPSGANVFLPKIPNQRSRSPDLDPME